MAGALGLVGVGKMGAAMARNFRLAGYRIVAYDTDESAIASLDCEVASSVGAVAEACSTVISVLPNDTVLREVSHAIQHSLRPGGVHVSVSTVSPHTSRELAAQHAESSQVFCSAPVFARPDGIAARNATWCLSGAEPGVRRAAEVLQNTSSAIYEYGADPGAANIAKLCGNFMIATANESIGEALALAENHGLEREDLMQMFSETIFDCLIYRGYGNRVAKRRHLQDVDHPGFALELGLKDVALVLDTAKRSSTPMPFASVMHERMTRSVNAGRGNLDWSCVGLSCSEDAGVDVADFAENPRPE